MDRCFDVDPVVRGSASGPLLFSPISLSFWGGIDLATGIIVDHHHPAKGKLLKDYIFALPSGRGSCTGSGAILELLLDARAPRALIFRDAEDILLLGVLVARTIFDVSIPIVRSSHQDFDDLQHYQYASIRDSILTAGNQVLPFVKSSLMEFSPSTPITLSGRDSEMLQGFHGKASQLAMRILVELCELTGISEFLDITQAHIDATIYIGPAYLQFAQTLVSFGAKFAVPTTLNALSLDYRRWKELGVTEDVAQPARALADAYMTMGAKMSFTCAPYLLESAPEKGQQIGWSESNAVVFANSVLGARTQKYPDLLDVCVALTGRAPASGCHMDTHRQPKIVIKIPPLNSFDDSAWACLGYAVGHLAGSDVPLIIGLETACPLLIDLKAFSAAFATTASAPMFHMSGVTPEAEEVRSDISDLPVVDLSHANIVEAYHQLNTAPDSSVDLISLGNPHFALEEFSELATLLSVREGASKVKIIVTTSRSVQEKAETAGYLSVLFASAVEVITDTCWCMIDEPIVPVNGRNLMTNSAKYAHYAPALVRRGVHFGSLAQCVDAAFIGMHHASPPSWLLEADEARSRAST